MREKTISAINHDKELARNISNEIKIENGHIFVNYQFEPFSKILIKLAKGHLCQAQDKVFDNDCVTHCNFKFKPDLSNNEKNRFEELPVADKAGECGNDFTQDFLIFERVGMNPCAFIPWHEI